MDFEKKPVLTKLIRFENLEAVVSVNDTQREDDKAMLTDLPEECMRLILLCLSDHHDLLRSADALKSTSHGMSKFGHIFDEQRLWRELCFFHFDSKQLKQICEQRSTKQSPHSSPTPDAKMDSDWEEIYRHMKRLFGLKETFAETLHLCLHCRTLFWEPYGHPCPVVPLQDSFNSSNGSPQRRSSHLNTKAVVPISPRAFLDFFSL